MKTSWIGYILQQMRLKYQWYFQSEKRKNKRAFPLGNSTQKYQGILLHPLNAAGCFTFPGGCSKIPNLVKILQRLQTVNNCILLSVRPVPYESRHKRNV